MDIALTPDFDPEPLDFDDEEEDDSDDDSEDLGSLDFYDEDDD